MKTYIQIGSNVGNDTFQRMIEQLGEKSRVVLVEPNPNIKNMLIENYRELTNKHEITICTFAISSAEGESDLYFYWDSQLSSLIKRKTTNAAPSDSVRIQTTTLKKLCEFLNIKEIHHLSIDTEGLDYPILLSIDTNEISIDEIIFEEWWPEQDDINGVYDTGPHLLEKVKEKYKDYNWERIVLENMQNFKLTKK